MQLTKLAASSPLVHKTDLYVHHPSLLELPAVVLEATNDRVMRVNVRNLQLAWHVLHAGSQALRTR